MAYNPEFFKLNEIAIYTRDLMYNDVSVKEYIHCKVIEHLKVDRDGRPEIIKVQQIHNLMDFLNGNKTDVSVREFKVRELNPFYNISRNITAKYL